MQQEKKNNKLLPLIIIIVLIGAITFGIYSLKPKSKIQSPPVDNASVEDTIAPTIDAATQVDLTTLSGKKEVLINISGIPTGTTSIDYELSYEEKEKGLQGVIGTIQASNKERVVEKQITLGTCSSGRCVYHTVVGKIKVTLKFTGSYGDRIFEKEYAI